MASSIWTALRKRVAPGEVEALAVVEPVPQPSLGLRLTGDVQLLDRPVVVRPDTVAVIFSDGTPPRLALPGERLRPRLLPNVDPLNVLVVNTAPVTLDVSIAKLTTLDDLDIERTTVRVSLQIAADEDFAAVAELAAEFGTDLEAHLLHAVERDVVGGVQGAVRTNRLADVRRLTLQGLLTDRWLPATFAGGALVRRDLTVLGMVWPAEPSPPREGQSASEPPGQAQRAGPDFRESATEVSWHRDEGLLKAWQQQLDSDVRGIAGAKVGAESTVIVVPSTELGAEESTRARQIFAGHFEDRRVHVVAAAAATYDDLVRAWFKQVDGSPGRLVSVEARDPGVLRITVDQSLASREERQKGLSIGTRSDREALRRLVPQERVVFVAADSAG